MTPITPPAPVSDSPQYSRQYARALDSLHGLTLGDSLGAQFFVPANLPRLRQRQLPPTPWPWTDDTEMACAVFAELATHGRIDQDRLAASFAR
ncbi:MAG: ADP-ribosylglycohydrolase family protein, partial [Streptomycetaceae bacterium]|nr:ADP-ribosylglycohydrolase family protein [Streptomycetaceae bacterium]